MPRIRVEGTRNLIDAMNGLEQAKIVAQSVAWTMKPGPEADAVASLEEAVLAAKGVVIRYGFSTDPAPITRGRFPRRRACTSTLPPLEPSKRSTPPRGSLRSSMTDRSRRAVAERDCPL
jgi:hypothetical protein